MENQEQTNKEISITPANVFETGITIPTDNGKEMHLSTQDIKNLIGNEQVNEEDLKSFMLKCYFKKINPFNNEAYLIVYKGKGTMITSKEFFYKKAEEHPKFDGIEAGIIIQRGNEVIHVNGSFYLPTDIVVGGWARVWRKDMSKPFTSEISFNEYAGTRYDRNNNCYAYTDMWAKKPATMICKVAKVQALREAFTAEFGGLYTAEEQNKEENDTEKQQKIIPIEATIIEEKSKTDIKQRISKMTASFLQYGVTVEMIQNKYKLSNIEEINEEQLKELGNIFKDIKSKKIKVEDVFKKENKDIVAEAMAKNKKEVAE